MYSRVIKLPQYQPPSPSVSLLQRGGIDARSVQKTPAGTVNNVRPCTLFTDTFAMQTCYCIEPPPSVAVLIRRGLFAAAAWMPLALSSSDVSAPAETRHQNYTRKYTFDDATQ